jgi:predicted TIM-barrel fold metal-dependent hydrolase
MERPKLVDGHIHLWDLKRLHYAWLSPPFSDEGPNGNVEPIAKTYLVADYLKDAAGWDIEGAVHVDAGTAAKQALEETGFVEEVARTAPFPLVHVAYASLNEPRVEELLAAHAASGIVRGIRQILNFHSDPKKTYMPKDLLDTPEFERGFRLLKKYGLSFDLQIYPGQMAEAAKLAERHPDTLLVLNHAGMPVPDNPIDACGGRDISLFKLWREGMKALAARPNVRVKISGFGIVDPGWSEETIRPFVLETIERFGPGRAMFASDVPTDKLHASFDRLIDSYVRIVSEFSAGERTQLFAATARETYRL